MAAGAAVGDILNAPSEEGRKQARVVHVPLVLRAEVAESLLLRLRRRGVELVQGPPIHRIAQKERLESNGAQCIFTWFGRHTSGRIVHFAALREGGEQARIILFSLVLRAEVGENTHLRLRVQHYEHVHGALVDRIPGEERLHQAVADTRIRLQHVEQPEVGASAFSNPIATPTSAALPALSVPKTASMPAGAGSAGRPRARGCAVPSPTAAMISCTANFMNTAFEVRTASLGECCQQRGVVGLALPGRAKVLEDPAEHFRRTLRQQLVGDRIDGVPRAEVLEFPSPASSATSTDFASTTPARRQGHERRATCTMCAYPLHERREQAGIVRLAFSRRLEVLEHSLDHLLAGALQVIPRSIINRVLAEEVIDRIGSHAHACRRVPLSG
mmetsp:Transcript_123491/g.357067  ORF Transcript_123491/g.357067 Transcript_123491/m.357067 type:complete len:387 (-) Transcript_123491:127-1287(-)